MLLHSFCSLLHTRPSYTDAFLCKTPEVFNASFAGNLRAIEGVFSLPPRLLAATRVQAGMQQAGSLLQVKRLFCSCLFSCHSRLLGGWWSSCSCVLLGPVACMRVRESRLRIPHVNVDYFLACLVPRLHRIFMHAGRLLHMAHEAKSDPLLDSDPICCPPGPSLRLLLRR